MKRKTKTTKKPDPISQAAFARRFKVSRVAVLQAIRSQRLRRSLVSIDGRTMIADVALAMREWRANTDASKVPDHIKVRRAARARAGGRPQAEDLSDAVARDKHFRAKLAELKYQQASGELVNAQEMLAAWIDHITIARTKVLGIPSKFKQRRPHQTLEDLADLDALLREALEDLAGPPTDAA